MNAPADVVNQYGAISRAFGHALTLRSTWRPFGFYALTNRWEVKSADLPSTSFSVEWVDAERLYRVTQWLPAGCLSRTCWLADFSTATAAVRFALYEAGYAAV